MADTDDRWHVLLPSHLHPAGPESLADMATFASLDDYGDRAALLADADRFDAVVFRMLDPDREFVEAATNLKVLAKHGVGLDGVDVDAATERGVVVCNTPGANAHAVAEHTLALLFAVRRRLREADRDVRNGEFERDRYVAGELRGDTLGVLGCGDIGSEVAALADAVGMDVITHDPYLRTFPDAVSPVESRAELFAAADAVSLHVPLTEETRGLVDADELASLDGELINVARGGVVDETALYDALAAGTVTGAGVDVYDEEPPGEDYPAFDFENVICTPHIGAMTTDALRAASTQACENVRTVYAGGVPESAVNSEAVR
ncbi:hydroxyacid dehydrogenase [Salinirarus marinus]|uniref:hydroxyacid dehydrogenase n=1 Tax=Salinirarus marinus TaxID=3068310 RepID=UPI003C6BFD2E